MEIESDGFSIIPAVFSSQECAALLEAISAPVTRAGARHLLSIPAVGRAAHDPRLLGLGQEVLGPSAVPFRATLFNKSQRSNWLVAWHQDIALPVAHRFQAQGWGPWSTKQGVLHVHAPSWALARIVALRLHLDPSREANGPLRLIPGSHRAGVLSQSEVASQSHGGGAVECLVEAGGVLVMRPLVIHSSSKATSPEPRRVLHIEYASGRVLSPEVMLAVA